MPTGYTAGVQTGKVTEFTDFAWQCARAFGALVEMRDEPMNAEIPEAFKPSTYHAEQVVAARKRLAVLEAMSAQDAHLAAGKAYEDACASWQERETRRETECQRYMAMLEKVRAWTPPTSEHVGMKRFMEEQLISSIEFDCGGKSEEPPTQQSGTDWLQKALADARWDLEYHEKKQREDTARIAGRNEWIRQLRNSLSDEAHAVTK